MWSRVSKLLRHKIQHVIHIRNLTSKFCATVSPIDSHPAHPEEQNRS